MTNSTSRTNYRWIICGLLFFSTTVNYMDRQVIGYLKEFFCTPAAAGGFGWTNSDFANVTAAFTGFYAGMTILAGQVIDKIGTKLGLALSLIVWSIFGIANAFVGSTTWMHTVVRSLFGIGEAGNFPASIKTIAEWFPKHERALATGIFNSGANVGAMLSALFVPLCLHHFGDQTGWKMAYILTGSIGFFWLIFWFWLYDTPARQQRLSKVEFDYIHSDREEAKAGVAKPAKNSFAEIFTCRGRSPAAAFRGLTIMTVILGVFVYFIIKLAGSPDVFQKVPIQIFLAVMSVLFSWVTLALHAKRWHDLGQTGWLAAISFLPLAATLVAALRLGFQPMTYLSGVVLLIVLLFLGFRRGNSGNNSFGGEGHSGLLGYRQTWSFFCGKFMTDGIWWFYLFWLPDYLKKQFGMTKEQVMWPTFIVYGIAIIGSIYGGSIPMTLMKRGMPVYRARMTAMFLIALCPLAVLTTQYFGNVSHFGSMASVWAVAIICIGAAAHQAWSANLFTTVSDMFPKRAVGSVTGIGAMAGGLGGVIVQKIAGALTDTFKDNPQYAYLIMFVICALSYLTAWAMMKALVPRHQPITDL